ncbi:hypothetical protein WJ973_25995 [Achromobacter xylosoxidans]
MVPGRGGAIRPARAATAALGLAYLLSIAILARDAGFVPGDGSLVLPLARLLLVLAALLLAGLAQRGTGSAAPTPGPTPTNWYRANCGWWKWRARWTRSAR